MRKQAFYLLLIMLLLSGCRPVDHSYNHEADDVISTAIYKEIGSDDIYYQGKEVDSQKVTTYKYLIVHEKRDQMKQLVSIVNAVLEAEDINNKISVECWVRINGAIVLAARLTNYSDDTLSEPDYDMLQRLHVGFDIMTHSNLYDQPSCYLSLSKIKRLEIPKNMQKKAEAENIDWYEIWPELENVEVFYVEDGIEMRYNIAKDENHEPDEEDDAL